MKKIKIEKEIESCLGCPHFIHDGIIGAFEVNSCDKLHILFPCNSGEELVDWLTSVGSFHPDCPLNDVDAPDVEEFDHEQFDGTAQ